MDFFVCGIKVRSESSVVLSDILFRKTELIPVRLRYSFIVQKSKYDKMRQFSMENVVIHCFLCEILLFYYLARAAAFDI